MQISLLNINNALQWHSKFSQDCNKISTISELWLNMASKKIAEETYSFGIKLFFPYVYTAWPKVSYSNNFNSYIRASRGIITFVAGSLSMFA